MARGSTQWPLWCASLQAAAEWWRCVLLAGHQRTGMREACTSEMPPCAVHAACRPHAPHHPPEPALPQVRRYGADGESVLTPQELAAIPGWHRWVTGCCEWVGGVDLLLGILGTAAC